MSIKVLSSLLFLTNNVAMSNVFLYLDLYAPIIVCIKENPSSGLSGSKCKFILWFYYIAKLPFQNKPFSTFTNIYGHAQNFIPLFLIILSFPFFSSLPSLKPSLEGGKPSVEGFYQWRIWTQVEGIFWKDADLSPFWALLGLPPWTLTSVVSVIPSSAASGWNPFLTLPSLSFPGRLLRAGIYL